MEYLPIRIEDEKVHAGFWRRFGAMWIDVIIFLPITFIFESLNSLHRNIAFFTVIPATLIFWFYRIYFHARWGATIGKMVTKVKVVRKDGTPIGYKQAILRFSVDAVLGILLIIAQQTALLNISVNEFDALGWFDRAKKIHQELMPGWYKYLYAAQQIWMWSEFLVLLFNKRKRALHDFIAGTVVIKKKFEKIAEHSASAES